MMIDVGGATVFAATGGRPWSKDGIPLVFVHGAGMDHTAWSLPARHFAHAGRRVLALDLPGHGRSAGAALDGIEAMARWIVATLDVLSIPRATLVGHSMGALVVLEAAAQAPDRMASIALYGGALAIPVHPALLGAARTEPAKAFGMIAGWGHGRRGRIGGHPTPGLWARGGTVSLLARGGAGVLATDLAACDAYKRGAAAAAAVRCPTLVVIAVDDRMTPPKAGHALAGAIQAARVVEIAGSGHMMLVEDSDATLDALRGFVKD
jgi:pimeloyl-ACP methyl ester carboxylesterase